MSTEYITCIARLKEGYTMADVAREVWEIFGRGGNPDAQIPEEYLGRVNHPVHNGYVRAAFEPEYVHTLTCIQEIDAAESAEIIRIETDGQTEYVVDEATGELLGYIAGLPMAAANAKEGSTDDDQ